MSKERLIGVLCESADMRGMMRRVEPVLAERFSTHIVMPKNIADWPNNPTIRDSVRCLIVEEPIGHRERGKGDEPAPAPFDERLLDAGPPVILWERIDGAQIRACRRYMPRIAGVIKGYTFNPPGIYNETWDRHHVELLRGIKCERPRSNPARQEGQLIVGHTTKICSVFGFGFYPGMEPYTHQVVDFDTPRPVDVTFAGFTEYEGSEIEAHRKAALEAARAWGRQPGRTSIAGTPHPLKGEEYPRALLRSKAVLCPWGWGEATHRHYQAMHMGAVVISPPMDHVACSTPRMFVAGGTYVQCKPDFSDAWDHINHIQQMPEMYYDLRQRARQAALDAWNAEIGAQRLNGVLDFLLGGR